MQSQSSKHNNIRGALCYSATHIPMAIAVPNFECESDGISVPTAYPAEFLTITSDSNNINKRDLTQGKQPARDPQQPSCTRQGPGTDMEFGIGDFNLDLNISDLADPGSGSSSDSDSDNLGLDLCFDEEIAAGFGAVGIPHSLTNEEFQPNQEEGTTWVYGLGSERSHKGHIFSTGDKDARVSNGNLDQEHINVHLEEELGDIDLQAFLSSQDFSNAGGHGHSDDSFCGHSSASSCASSCASVSTSICDELSDPFACCGSPCGSPCGDNSSQHDEHHDSDSVFLEKCLGAENAAFENQAPAAGSHTNGSTRLAQQRQPSSPYSSGYDSDTDSLLGMLSSLPTAQPAVPSSPLEQEQAADTGGSTRPRPRSELPDCAEMEGLRQEILQSLALQRQQAQIEGQGAGRESEGADTEAVEALQKARAVAVARALVQHGHCAGAA